MEFSNTIEGRIAAREYFSKIKELYEKHYRDPHNPEEYIGLNEREKEIKRRTIEEKNRILKLRIKDYVDDLYSGKPTKVFIYKNGKYRFSLIDTIKSRIRYYINKCRKREFEI